MVKNVDVGSLDIRVHFFWIKYRILRRIIFDQGDCEDLFFSGAKQRFLSAYISVAIMHS